MPSVRLQSECMVRERLATCWASRYTSYTIALFSSRDFVEAVLCAASSESPVMVVGVWIRCHEVISFINYTCCLFRLDLVDGLLPHFFGLSPHSILPLPWADILVHFYADAKRDGHDDSVLG